MKGHPAGGLPAALLILVIALSGTLAGARAQSGDPDAPRTITPQKPSRDAERNYLPPDSDGGGSSYNRSADQPYPPRAAAPESGSRGGGPYDAPPPRREQKRKDTYSSDEITDAGHRFFGRVSRGLGRVIEYAFQEAGRPNGYILGEEAGGAFVAGLRYGEGTLHTKNAGEHKVFWQGPSIGYDFGAEGSKTMILVYNLERVEDIYATYGGVDGSAYFIGGIGLTFQTHKHVTLAPIRSGVGVRLGANVGYLKYTRRPTWNPF